MTSSTITIQEMQELLIHAVKKSTANVFSTMLGLDVEAGIAITNSGSQGPTDGVVSLIGLAGPWMGTGSISCSPQIACKISSALLLTEFDAVDEEVLDAIGEITNMVIGNVKTMLEEKVGSMGLSIPTIIFGRNFLTKCGGSNGWTVVPFQFDSEKLLVQVCLIQNDAGKQGTVGRLHRSGTDHE